MYSCRAVFLVAHFADGAWRVESLIMNQKEGVGEKRDTGENEKEGCRVGVCEWAASFSTPTRTIHTFPGGWRIN